jgi:N,N'-diacetyl-8-epilegionaminate cytidylyltransferase
MKAFAFIFARGGSKGLPGKNIRIFAGKPLLAHSIEIAKKVPQIKRIFVSTDDENIADVARRWGAVVIKRPIHLALDDSSEWLSWQHAIGCVNKEYGKFDMFVSLPATAPLRCKEDVETCLKMKDENTDIVVTMTDTTRSPWFNMVRVVENGYVHLLADDGKQYVRRQDVPKAYDMTTVAYVANPEFILKASHVFDGRVRAMNLPVERALDIDTLLDFEIAEFLFNKIENNSE